MDLLTNFYKFTEDSKYCIGDRYKIISFFVNDNMTAYKLIITAISLEDFKTIINDYQNKEESYRRLNNILRKELEGIEKYKIDICSSKLEFLVECLDKRIKKTGIIKKVESDK